MPYTHLTLSSEGRHPLCPEEPARRALLHVIGRVAAGHVVLFALVDDHLHLVLAGTDAVLARLRQAVTLAVRAAVGIPLEPPYSRPVQTRSHLTTLVGYLLRQPAHHGLEGHPALTTGSCFPDLVGARRIPGLEPGLSVALPRFRIEEAFPHVGLSAPLVPASDEAIRRAGVTRILAAAAASAGVDPALSGKTPAVVAARRAALQLLADLGPEQPAAELGIDVRSARRLASRPPDALIASVRLRVALEDAVLASPLQAGVVRPSR